MKEYKEAKEALEGMVWQFAYDTVIDGKPALTTGGLSALESAFDALGWSDPHIYPDYDGVVCDVEGCAGRVAAQGGMWADTGYWCLCPKHSDASRKGKPQPQMKLRALDREARRNPETGCLPNNRSK